MKTLRHALVFISALLGTSSLHAAPGDLDLSFGGGGKVTTAIGTGGDFGYSVIQQADGKLVVAGSSWNGSNADVALVRYNADGPLDTGFDGDGKVTTAIGGSDDVGYSVIQQADGKLVVTVISYNGSSYDFALVRYNTDGSLDTGFDGDGKVTTAIGAGDDYGYSVIQQSDGKLVVAGTSYNGSSYDFALVRYNADGSLDASFDGDGIVTTAIGAAYDYAQSVIQQADGKLVVAGYSWNGSNDDVALVRYNTDGSLDTGFDGDGKVTTAIGAGDDYGYSVIQQSDGKLVVAGTSYNGSSYDFALVRYNADGSLDASFDGDGIVTTAIGAAYDYAQSVIQQADGKLVVAGYSWNGSNDDVALVRYNEDGSLDTSFDGDGKVTTAIGAGDDYGRSVIQQADGKLVVAGHSYNGNNYDVALVRYDSGQLITTTNLWLKKLATKVGAGSNDDRWSAQYQYNADRRSGQVFDPATDALDITLASSNIHLPAGSLLSKGKGFAYSTAKGVVRAIKV
ncbi:MAG TPA: delta-60 repeat domain-containing protein, partial [Pseudomonadales bacterium]|nr:delta-60 repeat domain-containing protein [Pseudomonadales bacterium]